MSRFDISNANLIQCSEENEMKHRSLLKMSRSILFAILVLTMLLAACAPAATAVPTTAPDAGPTATTAVSGDDNTIKVGVLHSLSGTMSISEVSVRDATLLAIKEINASGGVLGKQLVPVVEDGASDW